MLFFFFFVFPRFLNLRYSIQYCTHILSTQFSPCFALPHLFSLPFSPWKLQASGSDSEARWTSTWRRREGQWVTRRSDDDERQRVRAFVFLCLLHAADPRQKMLYLGVPTCTPACKRASRFFFFFNCHPSFFCPPLQALLALSHFRTVLSEVMGEGVGDGSSFISFVVVFCFLSN